MARRHKMRLPTKAIMTVTRKGDRVTFRYTESFGSGPEVKKLVANTKRILEMLPPETLRGLTVKATAKTIGVSGTVSASRFSAFMVGEFSCWASPGARVQLQSEVAGLVFKMAAREAAGADAAFCIGHKVGSGIADYPASCVGMYDGSAMPLCDGCAATVAQYEAARVGPRAVPVATAELPEPPQ